MGKTLFSSISVYKISTLPDSPSPKKRQKQKSMIYLMFMKARALDDEPAGHSQSI